MRKIFFPLLLLCLLFVGCGGGKHVDVFAGKTSDPSFQRDAMQQLSKSLKDNPSAQTFTVSWTMERDGKSSYPEITYNRDSKALTSGKSIGYSGVTDEAIHQVAAKHDAVVGLAEYGGATQNVNR